MNQHQTFNHKQIAGQRNWFFWPVVPIYPYGRRRTLRTEVVPETIWTFDQLQGIFYVIVPIRMTVVRLQSGGLLVYAPVAPTAECIAGMRELEAAYGPVKYIILSTVTGIEHKVFVGPFSRRFPQAQVYVTPNQWSFPLNLPLSWLGLPRQRTQVLPKDSSKSPFFEELDYAVLGPIKLNLGPFAEAVFLHRQSRTLLVTDSVMSVPADPPAILQQEPYPMLFHAKDSAEDTIQDTPENRIKGWRRIALFAFYFRPSTLGVATTREMLVESRKAPDRSRQNYFGLYPFRWSPDWQISFEALSGKGRLFVAPVLQTLIFNRAPDIVQNWVQQVSTWQFERIIPCHFAGAIAAGPQQFRQAFSFLSSQSGDQTRETLETQPFPLPDQDFELLRNLERALTRRGITPPSR